MQIKVNGEAREFSAPLSVSSMIDVLKLNTRQLAIERNREIESQQIPYWVPLDPLDTKGPQYSRNALTAATAGISATGKVFSGAATAAGSSLGCCTRSSSNPMRS